MKRKNPLRDYFLRHRGRVVINKRCRHGVFLTLLSRRNARLFPRTLPSLPCAPVHPARTHMERSRRALPAFAKDMGSAPERAHGGRSCSRTSVMAMTRRACPPELVPSKRLFLRLVYLAFAPCRLDRSWVALKEISGSRGYGSRVSQTIWKVQEYYVLFWKGRKQCRLSGTVSETKHREGGVRVCAS